MSETKITEEALELLEIDELKKLAQELNVSVGNSGKDKIVGKLKVILGYTSPETTPSIISEETVKKVTPKKESAIDIRNRAIQLVRVKISPLAPADQTKDGDYFTIVNNVIGKISKFVPFGPKCGEDGFHIPMCIYNHIATAVFNQNTTKENKEGVLVTKSSKSKRFNIEVLPPLTKKELAELASRQKANGTLTS